MILVLLRRILLRINILRISSTCGSLICILLQNIFELVINKLKWFLYIQIVCIMLLIFVYFNDWLLNIECFILNILLLRSLRLSRDLQLHFYLRICIQCVSLLQLKVRLFFGTTWILLILFKCILSLLEGRIID